MAAEDHRYTYPANAARPRIDPTMVAIAERLKLDLQQLTGIRANWEANATHVSITWEGLARLSFDEFREFVAGAGIGVVHLCPPPGAGATPCCGSTPFELPASDRLSTSEEAVTCLGNGARP